MVLPKASKPAPNVRLTARAVEPPCERPEERLMPRQARTSELLTRRDVPPQQERPAAELLQQRRKRALPQAMLRMKQQAPQQQEALKQQERARVARWVQRQAWAELPQDGSAQLLRRHPWRASLPQHRLRPGLPHPRVHGNAGEPLPQTPHQWSWNGFSFRLRQHRAAHQ